MLETGVGASSSYLEREREGGEIEITASSNQLYQYVLQLESAQIV